MMTFLHFYGTFTFYAFYNPNPTVKVITHKIEALKIFICHMSRYTAVKCCLFGLTVNDKE